MPSRNSAGRHVVSLARPVSRATPPTIRATAIVFEDPASRALMADLDRLAPSEASLVIIGETGTGKELVARYIHENSTRKTGPFVAVNCGALVDSLVEAELFGYEKGAFTGALKDQVGWFEAANGGTLLLDEIGDLPGPLQVKLLRVLQEREVVRLGARQPGSGRRARPRRHQYRPRCGGRRRTVPAGPLLPPERRHHPSAAAPRSGPATSPRLPSISSSSTARA